MLTLNDGRNELWQWDTGRKLTVDADCSQVHFSNKVFGRSIDVDVVGGLAIIPDILLQTDKELTTWAFVGTPENGYTKISKVFKVNKRNKPADYVFTPTDQTTLSEILDRIEDLEKRPGGDIPEEQIQNAVNDYLDKNPISIEEKDPTVPDWAKQPTKPTYSAKEVGALPDDTEIPPPYELPTATADALGGVKAIPATDAMTEFVGIDADGKLRVSFANTGGGSDEKWEKIVDFTTEEEIAAFSITKDINGNPFDLKECLIVFSAFRTDAEDGTAKSLELLLYTHSTGNYATDKWSGSNVIAMSKTTDKTYPMNGIIGFKMIDDEKAFINHFAQADFGWDCALMPVANTTWKNSYFSRDVGSDIASKGAKIDGLHLGNGGGGPVGVGSRFVMYGVRK